MGFPTFPAIFSSFLSTPLSCFMGRENGINVLSNVRGLLGGARWVTSVLRNFQDCCCLGVLLGFPGETVPVQYYQEDHQ